MTPTLLLIGWLACGVLTCVLDMKRLGYMTLFLLLTNIGFGLLSLVFYSVGDPLLWERKPEGEE
jgi:hypothetical protein